MASRSLAVRLTANTDGLAAGLTKGQAHVRSFASSIESIGARASGVFGGLGSTIAGAIGVAGVGTALGFGIKLAAEAEQAEVAFGVMLGSADKAKKALAELTQFAAATPFEFPELRGAAQKLLAFGTSADSLIGEMRMLGDISAGVGMPIGELAELYGKARVQGRMFASDINQLTGRGIPIIQELARQFGVNESAVRGLVESGQVGFAQIEQAFRDLTAEGSKFGGMMDAQSKTLTGLWSTFKDNVGMALRGVGEQLIETFDLKDVLARAIGFMESFAEMALVAARELGVFVPWVLRLGAAFLGAKAGIAAVNAVMRTYVVLQKAAAAASIVTQAVTLGPAGWAKLAAGVAAAGFAIAGMEKLLGDAEKAAEKTTSGLATIGDQAAGIDKAAEAAKRLAGNLAGVAQSPAELTKQVGALFTRLAEAREILERTRNPVEEYVDQRGQVDTGMARGWSAADQMLVARVPADLFRDAQQLRTELSLLTAMPGPFGQAAREAFEAFGAATDARYRLAEMGKEVDEGQMSVEAWEQAQRDLAAAGAEYLDLVDRQSEALAELQAEMQAAIDVFGSVKEAWKFGEKVNEDLRTAGDAIDETARKIQALVDLGILDPEKETEALAGQLEKAFGSIPSPEAFKEAKAKLEELGEQGVLSAEQVAALGEQMGEAFDKALGGPQKYLDDLAGKVDVLRNGWTEAQAEIERFAATPGVTPEQVAEMRALNAELERLTEQQKLVERGKSLAEQFQTPRQKLASQAADLEKLLSVGAIDAGTAKRAFQSYAANLPEMQKAQSPSFKEAGSREAYSAIVSHQEGRREMPAYVKDQLAKLERIAVAAERTAKAEPVIEEVDI